MLFRSFNAILKNLKVEGRTLVIVDERSEEVKRSASNLKQISLKEGRSINARDVLLNDNLLIEKEALEKLSERLK